METDIATPVNSPLQRSFLLGKLFSLTGLIPIGIYVVVHLYSSLHSLSGPEAFNQHLAESRNWPLIVPITILVVWIPIFFHGFYGLFLSTKARPNVGRFPFFENLKYVLQRLSGLGLLLFIPAHIFKTRIQPAMDNGTVDFAHMVEGMHEPLTLTIYILGVLGVAFHLANGVWQFGIGWGLTTTQRGMNRMQWVSYALFVAIVGMGLGAIWGFYRT